MSPSSQPPPVGVILAREDLAGVDRVYQHPDIPVPIERTVRGVHGEALPRAEPLRIVYDDTVFGGAEDGFVVTDRRICWKALGERPVCVPWASVEPHEIVCDGDDVVVGAGRLPLTGWQEPLADRLAQVLRGFAGPGLAPQAYRAAGPARRALDHGAVIRLARRVLVGCQRVYYQPVIPRRAEEGARAVHAGHLPALEPILFLYDNTLLGSGHDGFAITPARICWKNFLERPCQVPWHRLTPDHIRLAGKEVQIAGGRLAPPTYCSAQDVVKLLSALAAL